ncbi:MAG TPA: TetR family transcriptional regulator [Actinomycetota bacterium]|nr:TetR family transcriptional regulator [Actinomycetota bacterium]
MPVGLRERKKARTKAAIQEHALRLFQEQGYDATTVEQIAEAAEISPSTFFRYFPTKEDVVVWDDYDPMLIEAIRAQPAGLSPIQAIRGGLREAFSRIPPTEAARIRERSELSLAVPELRAASMVNLTTTMRLLAELVAERTGREPDDFAVRTFTGAVFGVWLSVLFAWADDPDLDLATSMDQSLAHLEAGLPF